MDDENDSVCLSDEVIEDVKPVIKGSSSQPRGHPECDPVLQRLGGGGRGGGGGLYDSGGELGHRND